MVLAAVTEAADDGKIEPAGLSSVIACQTLMLAHICMSLVVLALPRDTYRPN